MDKEMDKELVKEKEFTCYKCNKKIPSGEEYKLGASFDYSYHEWCIVEREIEKTDEEIEKLTKWKRRHEGELMKILKRRKGGMLEDSVETL